MAQISCPGCESNPRLWDMRSGALTTTQAGWIFRTNHQYNIFVNIHILKTNTYSYD